MKKRIKIPSFLLLFIMIINMFSGMIGDKIYAQGGMYDVWCDGTLGLHTTGEPLVKGSRNEHYTTDFYGNFKLPKDS